MEFYVPDGVIWITCMNAMAHSDPRSMMGY